ncbi:MAG: ester cyclase, partial [Planctomycetota bacterium]
HLTTGDMTGGHDLLRRVVDAYRRAFSDISVDIEVLVEDGDRVAWQRTISAMHTGSFQGLPATNLKTTWRDMVTTRFDGDLIAEEWLVSDLAEQLLRTRKR